VLLVLVLGSGLALTYADARPDPADGEAATSLLQRVRRNLANDDLLDRQYSYRVYRRTYDVSVFGKVTNDVERVYDVGPSPVDPAVVYSRPVSVGGRALTADELRVSDEKHRRDALRRLERQQSESPAERAERLSAEARSVRERQAQVEDAVRVYRFENAGYEVIDGERLRVVTVEPRPDVHTESSLGKQMKNGRGRAWVLESEGQLVRIEMQLVDTVRLGLGVIGHVDAGSRMMYRRARLADGTWVPVEARFVGTGTTLIFRPFSIETWAKYTDYRRLDGGRSTGADPVQAPARNP
jgi:hypothetical protein